jgi:hypothetical protein
MSSKVRKNGAASAVVDRALNLGLAQADANGDEPEVHIRLTQAQEKMVLELCRVLGLSVRSVLNAVIRYALHYAEVSGRELTRLPEFPRRLDGKASSLVLTAETLTRLQEAELLDRVPHCAVAGLKLFYERTLKIKPRR